MGLESRSLSYCSPRDRFERSPLSRCRPRLLLTLGSPHHAPPRACLCVFLSFSQRSAIEQDVILIDADTKDMLDAMNFKDLVGVQLVESGRA